MSAQQSSRARAQAIKETLIRDLLDTRSQILLAATALSPVHQEQVFLGTWSPRDVLAHLIGWDIANLRAIKSIRAGKLPAFYAYRDADWRTYNARLVSKHNCGVFAELALQARTSHQKLVDALMALPAEEFPRDHGVRFKGYKVLIARLLEAELQDEKVHLTQLQQLRESDSRSHAGQKASA